MIDQKRVNATSKVDVFIGIFFIIAGILLMIFWQGYWDTMMMSFTVYMSVAAMTPGGSLSYSFSMPYWVSAGYWIIILLSITTVIYGCKRTLDSILKISS